MKAACASASLFPKCVDVSPLSVSQNPSHFTAFPAGSITCDWNLTVHSDLSPFSLGFLQCISSVFAILNDSPRLAAVLFILCILSSSIFVFLYQLVDATVIWKSSTYDDVNISECSVAGCSALTYITNSRGDSGDPWGIPLSTLFEVLGLPG